MFINEYENGVLKEKFPVVKGEGGAWKCESLEEDGIFNDIISVICFCNIADNLSLEILPEERREIYTTIEMEVRSYQEAISTALCFTLTYATGVNYEDY